MFATHGNDGAGKLAVHDRGDIDDIWTATPLIFVHRRSDDGTEGLAGKPNTEISLGNRAQGCPRVTQIHGCKTRFLLVLEGVPAIFGRPPILGNAQIKITSRVMPRPHSAINRCIDTFMKALDRSATT